MSDQEPPEVEHKEEQSNQEIEPNAEEAKPGERCGRPWAS